jgi:hypothetical protein
MTRKHVFTSSFSPLCGLSSNRSGNQLIARIGKWREISLYWGNQEKWKVDPQKGGERSMSSHLFTVEEANALIPTLEEKLTSLQEHWCHLKRLSSDQDFEEHSRLLSSDQAVTPSYFLALEQFQESLEAIQRLGCELKGIEPGLVDFRALLDEQEVYLCWKQGEKEVGHWHPLHTGYAGRQPLDARLEVSS